MEKPKAFLLKSDSPWAKAGSRVYELAGFDYGLARDDTLATGVQHVSVTLEEDGDYPSFTVPKKDLDPVEEESVSEAFPVARPRG